MDFEKDYLDVEEEFEKPELTKGATRDTDPQYFTNIDGIYAKDAAGRAAVEELRTLVTGYSETVLFENDSMSPTSGTSNVTHTYTLNESIDNYDAVIVFVWGHCQMSNNVLTYNQGIPMLIPKSLYYLTGATANTSWAFIADTSLSDSSRRLCFSFTDSTHLFSEATRNQSGTESIVYKVIGIKY